MDRNIDIGMDACTDIGTCIDIRTRVASDIGRDSCVGSVFCSH